MILRILENIFTFHGSGPCYPNVVILFLFRFFLLLMLEANELKKHPLRTKKKKMHFHYLFERHILYMLDMSDRCRWRMF